MFFLCASCDHGQRYCSDRCRQKARRQQRREANRRHQQSEEGRLDHRDRQREYRCRLARRVTDQGSPTVVRCVNMPAPANEMRAALVFRLPPQPPGADPQPLLRCWRCGRPGGWVELFAGKSDDP